MVIRAGRSADLEAVRSIVERAYARYIPRMGRRPIPMDADYAHLLEAGVIHVLEVDGVVTGLIDLRAHPDHLLIENVAVDPDHQGRGHGHRLLEYAEDQARRSGAPQLRLYTNAAMTENIAMYLRIGYVEVDRRRFEGLDRVFFVKSR